MADTNSTPPLTLQQQIEQSRAQFKSNQSSVQSANIGAQAALAASQKAGQFNPKTAGWKYAPAQAQAFAMGREAEAQIPVINKIGEEIKVASSSFESEVSTKAPEYGDTVIVQQKYEEAKQNFENRINDLKQRIENKKQSIEDYKEWANRQNSKWWDRNRDSYYQNINDDEDRIDEYEAELRGFNETYSSDINSTIKNWFSGYASDLADYYRSREEARNEQRAWNRAHPVPTTQELIAQNPELTAGQIIDLQRSYGQNLLPGQTSSTIAPVSGSGPYGNYVTPDYSAWATKYPGVGYEHLAKQQTPDFGSNLNRPPLISSSVQSFSSPSTAGYWYNPTTGVTMSSIQDLSSKGFVQTAGIADIKAGNLLPSNTIYGGAIVSKNLGTDYLRNISLNPPKATSSFDTSSLLQTINIPEIKFGSGLNIPGVNDKTIKISLPFQTRGTSFMDSGGKFYSPTTEIKTNIPKSDTGVFSSIATGWNVARASSPGLMQDLTGAKYSQEEYDRLRNVSLTNLKIGGQPIYNLEPVSAIAGATTTNILLNKFSGPAGSGLSSFEKQNIATGAGTQTSKNTFEYLAGWKNPFSSTVYDVVKGQQKNRADAKIAYKAIDIFNKASSDAEAKIIREEAARRGTDYFTLKSELDSFGGLGGFSSIKSVEDIPAGKEYLFNIQNRIAEEQGKEYAQLGSYLANKNLATISDTGEISLAPRLEAEQLKASTLIGGKPQGKLESNILSIGQGSAAAAGFLIEGEVLGSVLSTGLSISSTLAKGAWKVTKPLLTEVSNTFKIPQAIDYLGKGASSIGKGIKFIGSETSAALSKITSPVINLTKTGLKAVYEPVVTGIKVGKQSIFNLGSKAYSASGLSPFVSSVKTGWAYTRSGARVVTNLGKEVYAITLKPAVDTSARYIRGVGTLGKIAAKESPYVIKSQIPAAAYGGFQALSYVKNYEDMSPQERREFISTASGQTAAFSMFGLQALARNPRYARTIIRTKIPAPEKITKLKWGEGASVTQGKLNIVIDKAGATMSRKSDITFIGESTADGSFGLVIRPAFKELGPTYAPEGFKYKNVFGNEKVINAAQAQKQYAKSIKDFKSRILNSVEFKESARELTSAQKEARALRQAQEALRYTKPVDILATGKGIATTIASEKKEAFRITGVGRLEYVPQKIQVKTEYGTFAAETRGGKVKIFDLTEKGLKIRSKVPTGLEEGSIGTKEIYSTASKESRRLPNMNSVKEYTGFTAINKVEASPFGEDAILDFTKKYKQPVTIVKNKNVEYGRYDQISVEREIKKVTKFNKNNPKLIKAGPKEFTKSYSNVFTDKPRETNIIDLINKKRITKGFDKAGVPYTIEENIAPINYGINSQAKGLRGEVGLPSINQQAIANVREQSQILIQKSAQTLPKVDLKRLSSSLQSSQSAAEMSLKKIITRSVPKVEIRLVNSQVPAIKEISTLSQVRIAPTQIIQEQNIKPITITKIPETEIITNKPFSIESVKEIKVDASKIINTGVLSFASGTRSEAAQGIKPSVSESLMFAQEPKSSSFIEPGPKNTFDINPEVSTKEMIIIKSEEELKQKPDYKIGQVNINTTKSENKLGMQFGPRMKYDTQVRQDIVPAVTTALRSIQRPRQTSTRITPRTRGPRMPRPRVPKLKLPKKKPPIIPPFGYIGGRAVARPIKKRPSEKGYEVLVKSKGKFQRLGVSLPKPEAEALGMKRVLGGSAATYKVTESGLAAKPTGARINPALGAFFRPGKKTGEKVQIATRRIISPGEKSQISFAGIAARKGKSRVKVGRKVKFI